MITQAFIRWKAIDAFGQIALTLLPRLFALLNLTPIGLITWNRYGISIAAWQLVSFFIHINIQDTGWKARGRKLYGLTLIFLLFIGVILLITGLIFSPVVAVFYLLVFYIPGLFYIVISIIEWRKLCQMKTSE